MKIIDWIKDKLIGLRKRENLCQKCPMDIRGLCCYLSVLLQEPDEEGCRRCTTYLRRICKFPKDQIKEKGNNINVLMMNQACKYLDLYRVETTENKRPLKIPFMNREEAENYCIKNAISTENIVGNGTRLCLDYKNRFNNNRNCQTIKNAKKVGALPVKCLYVKYNTKYKNLLAKVKYDDIKDKLCTFWQMTYDLENSSEQGVGFGVSRDY